MRHLWHTHRNQYVIRADEDQFLFSRNKLPVYRRLAQNPEQYDFMDYDKTIGASLCFCITEDGIFYKDRNHPVQALIKVDM